MIAVSVKYAGLPRSDTGKREELWPVNEGATLKDLLAEIELKYSWHLNDTSSFIIVYNDHGLDRDQWPRQALRDKDTVLIISPVAGG